MGISMKWLIVMGLVMMELESNLLCVNNKKNSLKLKFSKNEQTELAGTNFWTYCIISEKVEAKTETAKTTVDSLEIEKIDVTVQKTESTKPTVDSTTSVQPDVTTYKSIASPKQTNEIKTDENNWLPWGECTCDSDDMKLAPFKSRRNRVSGGRVHKNGLIRPKLVVLSDFRTSCDIKITDILEVFCWGWTWKIPYLLFGLHFIFFGSDFWHFFGPLKLLAIVLKIRYWPKFKPWCFPNRLFPSDLQPVWTC